MHVKCNALTSDRRYFIGGSDARIIITAVRFKFGIVGGSTGADL